MAASKKSPVSQFTEIPSENVRLYSLRTESEAAEFCGISPRTLQAWRRTGQGPDYVKTGRAVRYRLCDLIAFSEARTRKSTSAEPAKKAG